MCRRLTARCGDVLARWHPCPALPCQSSVGSRTACMGGRQRHASMHGTSMQPVACSPWHAAHACMHVDACGITSLTLSPLYCGRVSGSGDHHHACRSSISTSSPLRHSLHTYMHTRAHGARERERQRGGVQRVASEGCAHAMPCHAMRLHAPHAWAVMLHCGSHIHPSMRACVRAWQPHAAACSRTHRSMSK